MWRIGGLLIYPLLGGPERDGSLCRGRIRMGIRVGGHGQVFVACGQECAWRGGTFAILPRGETLKEAKRGGSVF